MFFYFSLLFTTETAHVSPEGLFVVCHHVVAVGCPDKWGLLLGQAGSSARSGGIRAATLLHSPGADGDLPADWGAVRAHGARSRGFC